MARKGVPSRFPTFSKELVGFIAVCGVLLYVGLRSLSGGAAISKPRTQTELSYEWQTERLAATTTQGNSTAALRAFMSRAANSGPTPRHSFRVIHSYKHDKDAFTQGLLWDDGVLFESTGLYGRSAQASWRAAVGVGRSFYLHAVQVLCAASAAPGQGAEPYGPDSGVFRRGTDLG
jgi:hypothetical protein